MLGPNWKIILKPEITDSAMNLAMEEWAVRYLDPTYSYLFLYFNRPVVVLGRHQNVLQEVNVCACWQQGVPILRRISGGGTVVHDQGNLNIAFITEHTLRNFNHNIGPSCSPLCRLCRSLVPLLRWMNAIICRSGDERFQAMPSLPVAADC